MAALRSLAARILILFLTLFVLVEVVAFVGLDSARMQGARALINDDLVAGGKTFDRQFRDRAERFFLAARVLSGDLGFKKAFGSGHAPTLLAAMDNSSARLGADVMLVVSLEGSVLADTARPHAPPAPFPSPRLIEAAARDGSATGIVALGERVCQVVVFPLLAPSPAAWLCIGYRLDDALARELKRLVSLDVTFVREGRLLEGTTLEGRRRDALVAALPAAVPQEEGTLALTLDGERHLGLARELETLGGTRVAVILQRSLDEALTPFRRVRHAQLLIFVTGFVAMLAGGVFVSTGVTRQLRRLAAGARSVEEGDYMHPVPVQGADELARLSKAFNLMQGAIARREEQIWRQANHDALTGLPNREGFRTRLEAAVAAARQDETPLALVAMNIDRFVTVIAALGFEPGNVVLRRVGDILGRVAPAGAVVARMHADVFAMLLPAGTDAAGAVRVVRQVQGLLETPFWIDDVPVQVEGRFGVVASPAHGDDAETLLRRVDVAVRLAKDSPTGCTVYSAGLDVDSRRHLELLGELRHALERNELTMFFQPKVDIATGRVAGLEALIRWRHARHGFIPPDEFIGLSEGTGLIKPVTEWTLDAAIGQCASLNRQGLALSMSINLSARLLLDQHLPALVASLVERHGVPPGQITLELTESALMTDPTGTLEVVTRLGATGVRLSVDDFGTGYSSLAYLQRLPVDELKIDKSFVLHMDTNESDAMIVRTIIELGHNLGLKVIAEGVESHATWELLKSRDCDLTQGFLHGKAMPLAELLVWSQTSPWGVGPR